MATVDYLSDAGARRLAEQIADYWYSLGYSPEDIGLRVEQESQAETFVVRSNLLNGNPPEKSISRKNIRQFP